MKLEIMGIVQDNPSTKGQSTSFRLLGGGPYLYSYGNAGEELLREVSKGDAVIASGDVNYNKDGEGNWEKYLNIEGSVSLLGNVKEREEESPKISFSAFGKIHDITPKQTKQGSMAMFKVKEKSVSWRGGVELNHSMVAFGDVAERILNDFSDGEAVIVKGDVKRLTNKNKKWYTSFNATYINKIELSEPVAQQSSNNTAVTEDDIPF